MAKGITSPVGVPGLSRWRGVLSEEYLAQLKTLSQRTKIYKQMLDDAVVGTLMDSLWMPLLAAEISTVAGGDEQADEDAAEFLQQVMDDMNQYSWRDHVQDMLSVTAWGWSISEMIFKKRLGPAAKPESKYDDGRIGLKILDPRGQDTLYEWKFNEETFDVEAMIQQDPNSYKLLTMESWKLVHATFRSRKRNPEGYSPLRSLYRSWYTRKGLEMIEAIGSERDLAGLPVIYLPFGAGDKEKTAAEEIVRKIRLDEESGIVIPAPPNPDEKSGWKLELLGSAGTKQYNVREVIRDLNKLILMRFFAQFLLLGMEKVGTQALVQGSQDFFSLALKSVQQTLVEAWNDRFIPLLFNLNAGAFSGMTQHPKIEWSPAGSKDVVGLGNLAQTLTAADILNPDDDLEDFFRAAAGFPDKMAPQPGEIPPGGGMPELGPDGLPVLGPDGLPVGGQPAGQPTGEPVSLVPPGSEELFRFEHILMKNGDYVIRPKRPTIRVRSDYGTTSEAATRAWDAYRKGAVRGRVSAGATDKGIAGNNRAEATQSSQTEEMFNISRAAGLKPDFVLGNFSDWNTSSTSQGALCMQMAVEEEFGLGAKTSHWALSTTPLDSAKAEYETKGKDYKSLVKAQYETTQKYLKENGIEEVTLFRGVSLKAGVTAGGAEKQVTTQLQPLSSFTLSEGVAKDFAGQTARRGGKTGYVVEVTVPASRVFSFGKIGLGSGVEGEVVVMGNGKEKMKFKLPEFLD